MNNRVLVLEDQEEISTIIKIILGNAGFSVFCCASIQQAQEALRNNIFHFALIDATLPDGTPLGIIETLNKQSSRVILMSGDLTAFNALDIRDYITLEKPFRMQALLQAVEAARKKALLHPVASAS